MLKNYSAFNLIAIALLAACAAPPTPVSSPTPTSIVMVAPNGYRPLQNGDEIEGTKISYQYILPSLDQPVVNIAFGANLLHLVSIKQDKTSGLTEYIQELGKYSKNILMFDETTPAQTEPQLMSWDPSKPVEIAIILLTNEKHNWSVVENQEGEIRAAFKLVRRKDGGLRFIDAYDTIPLHSANFPTINGTGAGLVFAARLALLRTILSDAKYQRGVDVMANAPPDLSQYDPRILKIDPARPGLLQNVDWVFESRTGPGGGLAAP